MKNHLVDILIALILFGGICVMLYPTVADWINTRGQSNQVSQYMGFVEQSENEEMEQMYRDALDYNARLAGGLQKWYQDEKSADIDDEEKYLDYNSVLTIGGTQMMGYLRIPKIDVMLPIYHGTSDAVLTVGVGHIEWSSLPVGGESSHCVMSGHTGLPTAHLFNDLDKVKVGDQFELHVLSKTRVYEVYDVEVVLPHQVESLQIVEGEDLCTLVTCTPYGVNSHRLLVHGRYIGDIEEAETQYVLNEGRTVDQLRVVQYIAVPFILLFVLIVFVILFLKSNRRR